MTELADMQRKADAYFAACDSTREQVQLKNGELRYYQIPYTIAGLCAALSLSREALVTRSQQQDDTGAFLRACMARIEQYTVERALLGELSNSVATLLLKSWGYGDAAEDDSPRELTVYMRDKEDWSQ